MTNSNDRRKQPLSNGQGQDPPNDTPGPDLRVIGNRLEQSRARTDQVEPTSRSRKQAGSTFRTAVISLQKVTTGTGILALPFLMRHFGLVPGTICILVSGLLTYYGFVFYLEAQEESGAAKIHDVVGHYLPRWMVKVLEVNLILDLFSFPIVNLIISWSVFNYFLFLVGWVDPEWVIDPYTLRFRDYHPTLFLLRAVVMHCFFLAMIPLFMKKDVKSLRVISVLSLGLLVFLLLSIYVQSPFYYERLHHPEDPGLRTTADWFKDVWNRRSVQYALSYLTSFYAQVQVFKIRDEMASPTLPSLRRLVKINVGVNYLLYIPFAVVGYGVWGDLYVPSLMILRKPIEGQAALEWLFRAMLGGFLIANFLGVSCFNPSLKQALIQTFSAEGTRRVTPRTKRQSPTAAGE